MIEGFLGVLNWLAYTVVGFIVNLVSFDPLDGIIDSVQGGTDAWNWAVSWINWGVPIAGIVQMWGAAIIGYAMAIIAMVIVKFVASGTVAEVAGEVLNLLIPG